MKKRFLFLPTFAIIPTSFVVVSCSDTPEFESLKLELHNLLNKPSELIKEIKLNTSSLNQSSNKTEIYEILNLSPSNLDNYFEIIPSNIWIDWNNKINNNSSLNDKEKQLLKLENVKIINIEIPSLKPEQNGIIDSINVIVYIDVPDKTLSDLKIKVDLKKYIKDEQQLKLSNYELTDSTRIVSFQKAINNHISKNSIKKEDYKTNNTKLNFKLNSDDFDNENNRYYQNNIYVKVDNDSSVDINEIAFFVYFSDSEIKDNIETSNKIYFKIPQFKISYWERGN